MGVEAGGARTEKGWVSLIDLLHSGGFGCAQEFEKRPEKGMLKMNKIPEEENEESLESEAFVSCDEEHLFHQPKGIVRLK